jgi:hypothetical protein
MGNNLVREGVHGETSRTLEWVAAWYAAADMIRRKCKSRASDIMTAVALVQQGGTKKEEKKKKRREAPNIPIGPSNPR